MPTDPSQFAPAETARLKVILNGHPRDVAAGATVADLLVDLQLQSRLVAVEVNQELVARQRHADQLLVAGDRIEIVTLVGGG